MDDRAADALEWAMGLTRSRSMGRVLDLGCGEGRFLPAGGIGLDLDPARLTTARARSRLVVRADAHHLPFREAAFDTVYAHRVLNEAGRIDRVLAEVRRVMRREGRLLVFTRARPDEGDRVDRWTGEGRLREHFDRIAVERHPTDERAAFFTARGPRATGVGADG